MVPTGLFRGDRRLKRSGLASSTETWMALVGTPVAAIALRYSQKRRSVKAFLSAPIMLLLHRLTVAFRTMPRPNDWLQTVGLLVLFALLYLPIGFALGFLTIDVRSSWQTILSVIVKAFFMPSLLEEGLFRVLPLPHSTESVPASKWWWLSLLSWCGFIAYHLHPLTPSFFREPAFLMGAGFIGIICTVSYRSSGSAWLPIAIHWIIVAAWLLLFGGLRKFQM